MSRSRGSRLVVLLVLFAASALLVACATEETETPESPSVAESSPELEEVATEPVVEQATEVTPESDEEPAEFEADAEAEEAAPEPTPEPTEEPTATPLVVVDVDSACVNCHTDADMLKELAEEPEAVHLSSGEG